MTSPTQTTWVSLMARLPRRPLGILQHRSAALANGFAAPGMAGKQYYNTHCPTAPCLGASSAPSVILRWPRRLLRMMPFRPVVARPSKDDGHLGRTSFEARASARAPQDDDRDLSQSAVKAKRDHRGWPRLSLSN